MHYGLWNQARGRFERRIFVQVGPRKRILKKKGLIDSNFLLHEVGPLLVRKVRDMVLQSLPEVNATEDLTIKESLAKVQEVSASLQLRAVRRTHAKFFAPQAL